MHTAYRLFHPRSQRPFNRKLRLLPVMGTNMDPLQVVYCYIPVNILLCRLVLCCLDGERVIGSDDSSALARFATWKRTTKLLCQHFRWKLYMMRLSDPFYS